MAAYITKRQLQNACYLFIAARTCTVCRYVSKITYVATYFRERTFFQSNSYLNRTYVSKVRLTIITECKLFMRRTVTMCFLVMSFFSRDYIKAEIDHVIKVSAMYKLAYK